MENRGSKALAIAALVVGVVGLTIGFAAFSATLTVKSGATVTPAAESEVFDNLVGFDLQTNETDGTVINPTCGTVDAKYGKTWYNIMGQFDGTGQSKTCTATILNDSEYPAYVKVSAATVDTCSGEGTEALTTAACGELKVEVTVDKEMIPSKGNATATITITGPTTAVDGTLTASFTDVIIDLSTAASA